MPSIVLTNRGDTLRRLEEEQRAFENFLARLRDAKNAREFDRFMDDRSNRPHIGISAEDIRG